MSVAARESREVVYDFGEISHLMSFLLCFVSVRTVVAPVGSQ